MKELLIKLDACKEAIEWAGDRTIEEIVKDCDRGDWLFWLAKEIDIAYATAAYAAYAAEKQNQKETAELCRKYIG